MENEFQKQYAHFNIFFQKHMLVIRLTVYRALSIWIKFEYVIFLIILCFLDFWTCNLQCTCNSNWTTSLKKLCSEHPFWQSMLKLWWWLVKKSKLAKLVKLTLTNAPYLYWLFKNTITLLNVLCLLQLHLSCCAANFCTAYTLLRASVASVQVRERLRRSRHC